MKPTSSATYIPALLRRRQKPLVIWAAPPLLVIIAVYNALFAMLVAMESSDASIILAGAAVSPGTARWIIAPAMGTVSVLMSTLAYGFAAGRPWTRALATRGVPAVYALAALLFASVTGGLLDVLIGSLPALVVALVAACYFARSSTIRAYYQTLGD